MKKGAKRILAGLLSLCMMLSTWTPAMTAEAATKLVNVALDGTASTEDGENGEYVIGHVNDGDDTTSWQTPGKWPATAVIQMAGGAKISKVVIKLGEEGDNDTGRTALVTVKYAMNGVIDTKFSIGEKRATVDSDVTFELSEASSATHVFVTLSDPQNADGSTGGFYPSVEEIEIYEEQEEEAISSYPNIANQAVITATGNNEKADEGSVNLVDGSDKTLYKFYNAAMTSEQSITLAYEQARSMDAFRIAFENVGAADGTDFAFCYSILAGNGNGEYDTIVERATANRTDNSSQQYSFQEKTYSEVKIVMHSCTTNGGNSAGWPAIAEFEVYGNEILVEDNDNIALRKSVHASSGRNLAKNITDGSKNVAWKGTYYPAYVDIDLEKNYNLNTVEVFTPENGYSQYTIYTSMDGRNFDKLAEKTSTDSAALETGESYNANGKEARIVRVYVEYNSAETAAVINEVRVTGTESGTVVQQRPAIAVNDFADSEYANADGTALTVTADDTYEEVYGIIERQLGPEYEEWFTLELGENPKNNGYDFFELSTVNGKVHVKGNDGVSLATGINHFLKYYCNVNISQVGDQAKMPTAIPAIQGTVHKETKAKVRYSYNYCTLSYSMAFYGEKEWRDELDWLALNGVNVVLDATAQEEVWRRFLGKLGYTHEEAKDFIAGPAYYAWAYMANLSGFGGPVHDSWFEERTELARKNQLSMRKLGMQPALQGYSGMVPTDILDYAKGDYALTSSDIIGQGEWCGFTRPSMLRTTNAAFEKYAELFYQCQKEVYGDVSDYYATDPFHEGGNTGGMNASDIAEKVLNSMLTADQDGIWIIQAWQGNPTTALLNGLDRITNGAQHALVLDLYAEKDPHYNQTGNSYGDTNEFDDTPWLFCMLNNFGGRLGLHGHLDNLAEDIPVAMNNSEHIAGIGITPEASVNNPVLYDFLFETVWQDDVTKDLDVIDLDSWLDDYATRRYGAESESANKAWDILKDTVYKSDLNNLGQGAPESVVNARPAFTINAASSWGNAVISYDKVELEKAAKLLLEDYDVLANSKGYMYDVANVLQQVLSNSAQEYHKKMVTAYNSRNAEEFEKHAEAFLNIIDYMETVTGTTEYFLLGRWVEQAKALAKNADDFTKELYELNAKALVTTWGSYNQTHGSQNLKDYSNRQWSGLIGDFYKERWELWIDARTKELNGQSYTDVDDWFPWEWNWVRSNTVYPTAATPANLETLGLEIIEKYTSENPAADATNDYPANKLTATAGTLESSEGSLEALFDGDSTSYYHSNWSDKQNIPEEEDFWITMELEEVTEIAALRYLPRQGATNGRILGYEISYSVDGNEWKTIATGTWEDDQSWKIAQFDEVVEAKYVKIFATNSKGDHNGRHMTAAELRLVLPEAEEEEPTPLPTLDPDFQTLANEMLAEFQAIKFEDLTDLVAPSSTLGYNNEITAKRQEIAKREGKALADVTEAEAWAEVKVDILYETSYEEAFNEAMAELKTTLPYILQNSTDDILPNKENLLESLKLDLVDSNKKKQMIMGLTYLYHFYDINVGTMNFKDQMIYDTAYFGMPANDLDLYSKLIKIGNSGSSYLKPANTVGMFNTYFKSALTNSTSLTAFLESEVSKVDGLTPDVWYKNAGNAMVVESASKEDPDAAVALYSKLKSGYPQYILPLLTVSENSVYVISNPATITLGLVDTYVDPSLKTSDPAAYAEEINAFKTTLESVAASQTDYLELWHRIAKDDDKAELRSNLTVLDAMRIKGTSQNNWASEEWSPKSGENASVGVKEFFVPMGLYFSYMNASAEATGTGMRFFMSKALSNDGLSTYTHELTHLLEESIWMNDYAIRDGLDGEFYARGMYETYWSEDPAMNLNMIIDYTGDSSRVYNETPERFENAEDLQEYAQGMMDVIYTLDYLEAQSALKEKTPAEKVLWFHQMTQTTPTKDRHNPGNGTHTDDTIVYIDETLAASLNTVDDLIDNNIVAQRYTIDGKVTGTADSNGYHVVPLFTSNYSVSENSNGASGAVTTRRQAYELLAEYGYYEGMVPYISNQYKDAAAAEGKVLSDTYIFDKIFGDDYADMKAFKKAMFARRIDKLNQLKPITITLSYNNSTVEITSVDQLQTLMDEAVAWDIKNVYETNDGYNNIIYSHNQRVEQLKAAVYRAYLQLTDDFTTSIYLEKEEPAPVDKTALAAAIAAADALVGTTYSADSWAALQAALAEAKTVNNNEDATAEAVANALTNLQNAQNALVENVAYRKPVTAFWTESGENAATNTGSSASNATNGTIDQNQWAIIGGNSRFESSYMEIDLGDLYDLETVNLYRYWPRTYDGTVIALYEDDTFTNPVIIHNSDKTNEHGLGAGTDNTYPESEAGMEFAVPENTVVRYIRVYMQGSSEANNADNHVVELQAWGQEATDQDILAAEIAKAEKLSSDGYTTDSWTTLQDALTAAKSVNADNAATTEEINKALTDLRAAKNALQIAVDAEKDVFVKAGETVTFLDLSGTFFEKGLEGVDTSKATVNVETKTISDQVAKLFDYNTADTTPAIERYKGASINLSDCMYTFEKIGEDTYYIYSRTENGDEVYLNVSDSTNAVGCPNTITKEEIKVTKVTSQTGVVEGFSFQDMDINNVNGNKYTLQFIKNWGVFNENTTDGNAQKLTTFKLKELSKDENGSYVYKEVTELQDGGSYVIVAAYDSNADGTLDVEYVLHPSTSSTAAKRNDHVALLSGDKADISGNEITITGVSAGDTSAVVGTTKYNIHVIEEKTITLKAGDSVRLFNQTGRFDESGLDTLNNAIANAKVETISITDDVAKLYSGSGYDGTSIDLNSCIYTFNKNEDGTYYIVAVTEDDKTVYLNPHTGAEQSVRGFPSTKEVERITIESTENGFKFLDSSENEYGNNYCLTFINEWKVFNEDPSKDAGGDSVTTTTVFKLKELQEMSDGSYDFVEVSAIQDGGQYIIVASTADGDFVLRPSASTTNRNDHVAKVTAEATTENGNEIVISGVSVGETKMTVGNTIYNIRVTAEERYLEIKVGETLNITGTTIEQQPDTEFAVLKENAGNGYLLTGIAKGETTFVIDEVIYHVSVVEIEVASGIGTSLGLEVNKLTMSANNTFDLNIINSDSNEVQWYITDKNGNPAEWATISDDGVIEAKDKSDSKNTYEGYIVAEVDGKVIKTELKISPAPTAEETRLYDVYVGELHHTDVYYGWLYEYDGADNAKAYGSTDLTKVVEGEVIYVSMGKNYENALDFFAKPESGYALTQMGSTGSAGHYMRLEGNAPEKTEFIEKVDVAGYQQYHQIDAAATAALVQKAMDLGCHGAQGFTRYDGHEGVPSILNYRSEKLPTVTKTAIGISGPNGYMDDYREYEDGVKAQIGDYVYFKVVVDTYECEDLVTYNKVMLEEQLEGAVFVNKEESGFIEVSDSNANIIDITTEVDADGYEAKSHDYYVKYQIQAKDVASVSHSVVNTVALTYEYGTYYSSGTFESDAKDDAQILITDVPMQSIVVDYGLPVTYTLERTTKFQEMSEDTLYGKVTVTSGEKEGSEGVYENIITYTPMDVLAGPDAISLIVEIPGSDEQKAGDVCVVGVYPASTVDYEEGFANYTVYGEGSWGDNISRGNGTQSVQYIDQTNSGESTDDDVVQNYGYDEKYAAEYPYTVSEDDADQNVVTAGPSNRTEAVSTTTGNSADFAFTGTGIDIFANGQSEQKDLDGNITQLPTGSVTVMIRNADTGAIEKMMMVNTKVKGGEGITQVQDTIAAAYHMPIVSVNDLEAGKHSVKLIHTLSQEEYEAKTVYPVRLDGFRVYHTLEDESIYREHRESNPNFIEMRNTVLNALNIELLYKEAKEENSEQSIYAEDIAKGLTQVLDKNETGTVGNAIVLDNAGSTDFVSGNAQDLLDNGPKNELFLYKEQTLTFKLKAGLQNVQIGLKALNGQVTVTKPKNVNGAISDETITISSSTDMFYVIGDITEDTVITITNKGENVLSVTELKYFAGAATEAAFCEMTESDYKEALVAMGYKSQSEDESGDIETTEVKVSRISGDDRYQTAYKVAEEYKDILGIEKFDAVIVATGKTFADALSGSYLATVKKAPILLTNGKSKNVTELTDYIEANLKENGTVYILGGTGAVSETTEEAIKAVVGGSGENVKRLFGANRYETNLAILNEATDHGRELIIATGRSFADSLSASATGLPILLVKDEFTEDQLKVLMRFDGAKFYILGGTGAVSQEIQDALYGRGRIYRLSGENRYETSVEVAKKFFEDADTAVVASAQSFPDGLCGGPLAAAMKAPMLLTADGKTKAAASYAQEFEIQSGVVLGGTGRISDHSVKEIFGLKEDVEIFVK